VNDLEGSLKVMLIAAIQ